MSKEEKKASDKIVKAPAKTNRAIRSRRHVPSTHVLATFDDMLEDFRNKFRESIWTPWDWAIEPYTVEFPIRETYSDLEDAGNKFIVRAEVPGIPRDKIDVTMTKNGIEISGEMGAEKEEKEKNFVVRERSYSSIYKRLEFPEEVIPDKADCVVKDGILEVSVPKKTPVPEVKKHKIAVKEAK